ncbi:MAG: GTPase HflX, partial [Coriobacteriia bacterium]|nr:GTPase HflX [Coriobacteriia bacterium]
MLEFDGVKVHGPDTRVKPLLERAITVGVDRPGAEWSLDSSLAELERLVNTAGAEVVASTRQRLDSPNPRTFI